MFLTELKKQMWNTFADSDLFYFSSIIFKNITVSLKKQLFRKKFIVEEELDCIDIDDTGNLEDSPRLVLINEECGNLIVVNDGGELTENISWKRQAFCNSLNVHSLTNVVSESFSSVTSSIFIVKQLGKHDFSYDFSLSNKYERHEKFFWSDE